METSHPKRRCISVKSSSNQRSLTPTSSTRGSEILPSVLTNTSRGKASTYISRESVSRTPLIQKNDSAPSHQIESGLDIQSHEDSDATNETFMGVDMRDRGTIGCAYYSPRDQILHLMEDIKMGCLDIIDTLRIQIQPTVILICNRTDEEFENRIRQDARGIDREGEGSKLMRLFLN